MFKLIYALNKMCVFSPLGIYSLISSIYNYGINIMALLSFAGRLYPNKTALVDENETLSYKELWIKAEKLSYVLMEKYQIATGKKVGFLCKNHSSLVQSIFAISQLGADIYLLNPEMSIDQFNNLVTKSEFDLLIYDFEFSSLVEGSIFNNNKILSYHDRFPAINTLLKVKFNKKFKLKRSSTSKLVIRTGGTTGNFKEAAHKPSLFNYLNPFLTILHRLKLTEYKTAYIATPIYHGYGIAVLLLFIVLGKKVVISNGFDANKACSLICKHDIEVVTVVPLMLYKMLKHNIDDLKTLACIASGGAKLSPQLIHDTKSKLGDVLYNLYGTSEAGLNIIATPQDLNYAANTIGKKINSVNLKILDEKKNEVKIHEIGQLCIKNKWSMRNSNDSWIETGDLGYRDQRGYYFLCGRVDDMIVSAGENVYPVEVEQILINHPQIEDAAVIGVDDEAFGQRLKAFVLPVKDTDLTKEELLEWLRSRVARFQLPKDIIFVEDLPYTPLGKLNRILIKSKH